MYVYWQLRFDGFDRCVCCCDLILVNIKRMSLVSASYVCGTMTTHTYIHTYIHKYKCMYESIDLCRINDWALNKDKECLSS